MKSPFSILLVIILLFGCGVERYSEDEVFIPNDTILFLKSDMTPLNGIVSFKYENGQLKDERNYKDGNLYGLFRMWYKNGQLIKEVNNKNGSPDGLYRGWYENGQLKFECDYKNGLYKKWHENGQLKSQVNLNSGLDPSCHEGTPRDGLQRAWYKDGQLQHELIYKDDKLISKKEWDEEGDLIIEETY